MAKTMSITIPPSREHIHLVNIHTNADEIMMRIRAYAFAIERFATALGPEERLALDVMAGELVGNVDDLYGRIYPGCDSFPIDRPEDISMVVPLTGVEQKFEKPIRLTRKSAKAEEKAAEP